MRLRRRSSALDPLAYSLEEAAEVSGLGVSRIKQAIAAGELPVVQIGKRVLVLQEDQHAYLARHRVTRGNGTAATTAPLEAAAPPTSPTAIVRISAPQPRRGRGRPPGPARRGKMT
jgi:excisionase family DNA binding protein